MKYLEIKPGEKLKQYVRCFYLFESDTAAVLEDIVFPGGQMEMIFNLGEAVWKSGLNNIFQKTPRIELWGQLTRPLPVRSQGKNKMLGIRFYPHSAACFLTEGLWEFNDQVSDATELLGRPVRALYSQLLETNELNERVALIENYLQKRLFAAERKLAKLGLIGSITQELCKDIVADNIRTLATKYNLTPRYLQKLFLRYTGVTPKLYHKINRFQLSLNLVSKRSCSLTAIAYECGYFDQSHFIREFKSFTGFTPSEYTATSFPVSMAICNS